MTVTFSCLPDDRIRSVVAPMKYALLVSFNAMHLIYLCSMLTVALFFLYFSAIFQMK